MMTLQRSIRVATLLALFLIAVSLSAQEDSGLRVAGSGITNPALESLLGSADVDATITNTGTNAGFAQLCAGDADIVTATRTIAAEEAAICEENGIVTVELLIGYDVLAFIANPDDEFLTCLSVNDINTVFAPSATERITDWNSVIVPESAEADAEATPEPAPELPEISVFVPQDNTLNYVMLDEFVTGVGLRDDATVAASADILEAVASTSGAIGVVSLANADESVRVLEISGDDGLCTSPSVESVEADSYPVATSFYLYVTETARPSVEEFLTALVAGDFNEAIAETRFTPASEATFEINREVLAGEAPERAFSAEEATYTLPPNTAGTVNVAGATSGFRLATSVANQLSQTQQSLTINRDFTGEASAVEGFCNGETEILFVNGDGENVCEDTSYYTYPIGWQAAVLVANAESTYSSCLTTEQIDTIWQAASTDEITQWSQVAEAFPEETITLFSPREGDPISDLLTTQPIRLDVAQQSSDALFRAAATANVSGALTYMSWPDYQAVLENEQQNVQLVAVNAGDGCVVPGVNTITDGSYPLSRQTTMLVSEAALSTVPVQGYVWQFFIDTSLTFFEASDFVGVEERDLAEYRTQLLSDFRDAGVAASEAASETAEETDTSEPADE